MKRMIALLLAGVMMFGLAACGEKPEEKDPEGQGNQNNEEQKQEDQEPEGPQITDALELLNTVWASYADEEKFPAAGGDSNEANMSMEGPGKFGLEDAAALDSVLAFPEAAIAKIDDAASMTHMMMANNFSCGAFRVTNEADVTAVVDALKENIKARQWVCGMPEKYQIITVGNYVVTVFGVGELMDPFVQKLQAAYETAEIVYDEPIM